MKVKNNIIKHIPKKGILLAIVVLMCVSIFIFNVFYASDYTRFLEINLINSVLIFTFLMLLLLFGIILGRTKATSETIAEFDSSLTEREKEIVLLIIERKKNIEIANTLFVELSTIKSHINNIYKKEGVKNRKDIIQKYKLLPKESIE